MFWITGILGILLMVAPFALGYSTDPTALWTSIALGAVMGLVSGYKAWTQDQKAWEYWVTGIAGVLAVLAPFVLGFNALALAMWTSVILGAVVALVAAYEVFFVLPTTS